MEAAPSRGPLRRQGLHLPAMEAAPIPEDLSDVEDYINDPMRFNVTHRVEELFPRIDAEPAYPRLARTPSVGSCARPGLGSLWPPRRRHPDWRYGGRRSPGRGRASKPAAARRSGAGRAADSVGG